MISEQDKKWLDERFNRVYDHVSNINEKVAKVEVKASWNQRIILMIIGGLILISTILTVVKFEF